MCFHSVLDGAPQLSHFTLPQKICSTSYCEFKKGLKMIYHDFVLDFALKTSRKISFMTFAGRQVSHFSCFSWEVPRPPKSFKIMFKHGLGPKNTWGVYGDLFKMTLKIHQNFDYCSENEPEIWNLISNHCNHRFNYSKLANQETKPFNITNDWEEVT